jgi:hypothetical protein
MNHKLRLVNARVHPSLAMNVAVAITQGRIRPEKKQTAMLVFAFSSTKIW